MKKLKKVFSKLDIFGVDFSFKYKNHDKYKTSLGGLFFILFCIAILIIVIYYFIPFINRKNYSIIYYSMNLAKTEKVILKESKASFAIGLTCNVDKEFGIKGEDLLNFESRFIILKKERDGSKKKTKEIISSHPCTYADFYNNYNEQVDILGLNHLQCLDKTDYVIEGLYTDEIFAYYEFSVISKEDNPEHFDKIYNYLTRNDCYLEFYYMDISFDLNNYKEPIKPYMNSLYIQLNPITLIKKNIYFMNQYFDDDDYLVFVYDRQEPMRQILFSKTEEITFYKGKDRGIKKPGDYDCYAKFYIRADIKKTEIKRKYQKIMEFYADVYSLLIALLYILMAIFNLINSFYANISLEKKIFLFREIRDNHFDVFKKYKNIKKLIDLTESPKNTNQQFQNQITVEKIKNDNYGNNPLVSKEIQLLKSIEKEEISTYKIKGNIKDINEKNKNKISKFNDLQNEPKTTKIKNRRKKRININSRKSDLNSATSFNYKSNLNETKNIYKNNAPEIFEVKKGEKINYSYNIFEIIISSFFGCCMTRKLKLKNNLHAQANNIIYNKLDVVLYLRSMLLLDVMSTILLDNNKKNIIEFLIHPKLSIDNNQENENKNKKYFGKYGEDDFNNFYDEISNLIPNSYKMKNDKILISLSNNELKKLI